MSDDPANDHSWTGRPHSASIANKIFDRRDNIRHEPNRNETRL